MAFFFLFLPPSLGKLCARIYNQSSHTQTPGCSLTLVRSSPCCILNIDVFVWVNSAYVHVCYLISLLSAKPYLCLQEFGDHPNIVKLLNVIRAHNDKDIYLVFEYMGEIFFYSDFELPSRFYIFHNTKTCVAHMQSIASLCTQTVPQHKHTQTQPSEVHSHSHP